jgi:hypothetical protein
MATNEELQTEIAKLNTRLFRAEVRLEALIRWMESKGTLPREEYQTAVNNFQAFNNAIGTLLGITSIMDRVNGAADFNKNSIIKIHGEDLGLQKIIEDAGGTSDFTARLVLAKLPCSPQFSGFMKQFIDPTKNPSADALIPDQVINPQ